MGCAEFIITDTNLYQTWVGLPNSPEVSGDYPYQAVLYLVGQYALGCYPRPIGVSISYDRNYTCRIGSADGQGKMYRLVNGVWEYITTGKYINQVTAGTAEGAVSTLLSQMRQSNQDIYYGETLFYEHTTTNIAGKSSLIRLKKIRYKNGSFQSAKSISLIRDGEWGSGN